MGGGWSTAAVGVPNGIRQKYPAATPASPAAGGAALVSQAPMPCGVHVKQIPRDTSHLETTEVVSFKAILL